MAEKQEEFLSLESAAQDNCEDAITQIQDTLRSLQLQDTKLTEENTGKKTESFKWKCAVHVLFSLIDIRSQKSKSKFSELFGLAHLARCVVCFCSLVNSPEHVFCQQVPRHKDSNAYSEPILQYSAL